MPVTAPAQPSSYFQLVRAFPLTRIRDDAHRDAAVRVVDRLLQEELDEGGEDYLDVLAGLVEAYEEERHPIPDASEADVLAYLMGERGLTRAALAKSAGVPQPTLAAVLTGSRSLTKNQVLKLARYFQVPPAVFLPSAGR
jgi:HTH-type transcriptional regulator/antitoxin HigA